MNKAFAFGLTAAALILGACGGEPEEEKKESSSSNINLGCVHGIDAPVGSPEWRAALDACLAEDDPGGDPGDLGGGAGGGRSCAVSVQCVNGSCTCGSGPNAGAACDGSRVTGADSCSVLCSTC